MKKVLLALALLLAALAAGWFLSRPKSPAAPSAESESQDAKVAAALSKAPPRSVAVIDSNFAAVQAAATPGMARLARTPYRPPAPPPTGPQFTALPPVTVMENMRTAVRNYGSMFGGNPVGTNEEITRALNGENPRQVHFFNADAGLRLNRQGELIDPWGTPFFFHQLSGQEMEIRSAGPDRVMYTEDDLVIR